MKIWIFNNYNMMPEHGGMNRHYYFGKNLKQMGHEPVVFVGSHPHNTDVQLIESKEPYKIYQEEPFSWMLVRTVKYGNNRKKQIVSMFQYCWNARKASKVFEKPDVIMGSSAHPLAAVLAIQLARKHKCKAIVEVRDLWPESIVEYGIAGAHNPIVFLLRCLEKWIYKKADALIFTTEGAYDYIVERGWEKEISRDKVFYINNGIDLEQFDYNRDHFQIQDDDLDNGDIFKVVYTGSIRRVNNLGLLLDTAKAVTDPRIKFLVWGDGDELPALRQRVEQEQISSVAFKGRVEKKYVPYIVSKADMNIAHNNPSNLFRFGISFNKLFDYLAGGKPILADFLCRYNPVVQWGAGIEVDNPEPEEIAKTIETIAKMQEEEYAAFCNNARTAASEFDFSNLTKKLITIIEQT